MVWRCGEYKPENKNMIRYRSRYDTSERVEKIKFFKDNKIKIKDIECGMHHNMALDTKGNIYTWGYNTSGQCGDGTRKEITEPKLIDFKGRIVKSIKCGSNHSYAMTSDGKHWLWGSNGHNECLVFNDRKTRTKPYCINEIVKQKCQGKRIKDVFLGDNNSKLILFD